jgi:protein SCO1
MAAWAAVALAAAGWAVYAFGGLDLLRRKDGSLLASVTIGGPFKLTAQDGRVFDSAELKGKPYALFFGFTRCPDICPTTMLEMGQHLQALGPAADKLKAVFVTVDPERDTPELLKDYLSAFDTRIIGLTGTPAEIAAVAKSYRAFYEKVPSKAGAKEGDYTMNHTASVYLMDGNGKFKGTFNFQEKQEIQREKLRRLAAE